MFWVTFWPGLTAMVGFWATLALNIPDFTRFARSQKDQIIGESIGFPCRWRCFRDLRGGDVRHRRDLRQGDLGPDRPDEPHDRDRRRSRADHPDAGYHECNLAANLVGPAYDFSSLWPKGISYRVGGMITATIAIVMMPWKILATTQGYIFTWLVGYSALLGPVAGILMVDYFLIRGTRLDPRELFDEHGEYSYTGGWNIGAVVALVIGVLPNLPGFLHTAFPASFPNVPAIFNTLYTYAWFVGLALASIVYGAWMKLSKGPSARMASA